MGLRDHLRELAKSPTEQEADDIRTASATRHGAGAVGIADRQMGTVAGVIRSVTLAPIGSVPQLEAEVFDGKTAVRLVWVGQRRIPGIEPGVYLRAEGRVCVDGSVPTIRNPRYDILPSR